MRSAAVLSLLVLFSASFLPAFARGHRDRPPDARRLADLQARAAAATPRDEAWLYAELVHSMSDIATEQFQSGQDQQAAQSLFAMQSYAGRICRDLRHARRLVHAEILVRHAAFRLGQLLSGARFRDRPVLEATIRQLNQVRSEMLTQVFEP